MFDTIILYSGAADHALLSMVLKSHNPGVAIVSALGVADLATLSARELSTARLISFGQVEAVPVDIVDALGFGAYQFQVGTPAHAGPTAAMAALSERATHFGAVLTRLIADAQAPTVVDLELFPISGNATIGGLQEMACNVLVNLFWRYASRLATQVAPLPHRQVWTRDVHNSKNASLARRDSASAYARITGREQERAIMPASYAFA